MMTILLYGVLVLLSIGAAFLIANTFAHYYMSKQYDELLEETESLYEEEMIIVKEDLHLLSTKLHSIQAKTNALAKRNGELKYLVQNFNATLTNYRKQAKAFCDRTITSQQLVDAYYKKEGQNL